MKSTLSLLLITCATCMCGMAPAADSEPSAGAGKPPAYQILKAGEIKPGGWLKEQMRRDLEEGYYAQYGKVSNTVLHDLYVRKDRFSDRNYEDPKKSWWSGEHEGYWKDGYVRLAFFGGDKLKEKQALAWMDEIVDHQDPSGYLGIYADGPQPNTRYKHQGENGELWTQSRILQALIAAFEFTGMQRYFTAVQKQVDLTIAEDSGSYFGAEKGGGISHGIGFFDAVYYLYTQTGDRKYADYAIRLYQNFNASSVSNSDLQTAKLLVDINLTSHGAHLAEGFYVPGFIAGLTEDPRLQQAADKALEKLKYSITPGGAMISDEAVKGRPGGGDVLYEYCGITELVLPLERLVAITGDLEYADLAESMSLNAGQGARLPVLLGLSYLSSDDRISTSPTLYQGRLQIAATHTAAACCVLNGGRLMPSYVGGMWMRDLAKPGLTAVLFGPCAVQTTVADAPVTVTEDTAYPFSDAITFRVKIEKPQNFALSVRIPHEAKGAKVQGVDASEISRSPTLVAIDREWKSGDSFTVTFDFPVEKLYPVASEKDHAHSYFKRGPLVYALEIPTKLTTADEINKSGFFAYNTEPESPALWKYTLPADATFTFARKSVGDVLNPWAKPPVELKGMLLDEAGKLAEVALVPIGSTILRRVTFPAK